MWLLVNHELGRARRDAVLARFSRRPSDDDLSRWRAVGIPEEAGGGGLAVVARSCVDLAHLRRPIGEFDGYPRADRRRVAGQPPEPDAQGPSAGNAPVAEEHRRPV